MLFKNSWQKNKGEYGYIKVDTQGIHFFTSRDRQSWEPISDNHHPKNVLSETEFDAVKGFGRTLDFELSAKGIYLFKVYKLCDS